MEDDDECLCDHPEICTCVFEMDWMRDLLVPIAREGYEHGFSSGVDAAIRDTIYGHSTGGLCDTSEFVLAPDYAYVDPCRYQRAYYEGYQAAYADTYQRHESMLDELRLRHIVQVYKIYLLTRFQLHPLLDLQLLLKIENYVWDIPPHKPRRINRINR
jgi:hypothetical protein